MTDQEIEINPEISLVVRKKERGTGLEAGTEGGPEAVLHAAMIIVVEVVPEIAIDDQQPVEEIVVVLVLAPVPPSETRCRKNTRHPVLLLQLQLHLANPTMSMGKLRLKKYQLSLNCSRNYWIWLRTRRNLLANHQTSRNIRRVLADLDPSEYFSKFFHSLPNPHSFTLFGSLFSSYFSLIFNNFLFISDRFQKWRSKNLQTRESRTNQSPEVPVHHHHHLRRLLVAGTATNRCPRDPDPKRRSHVIPQAVLHTVVTPATTLK